MSNKLPQGESLPPREKENVHPTPPRGVSPPNEGGRKEGNARKIRAIKENSSQTNGTKAQRPKGPKTQRYKGTKAHHTPFQEGNTRFRK
jgi:hypothetical protein